MSESNEELRQPIPLAPTNGYENVKHVKRVDRLELENLPRGEFSRRFIELAENGMSRPIQVPVVVARGKKDGPIFGITAALHGNELNGIPVIHQLLRKISLRNLRGTIVCVIVANVPGFLTDRREFIDGVDLNHIMPGNATGKMSHVYAHNLVDRITSHFDYLVDLHTASPGRVNSLYVRADLQNPITARMAYLLQPQIIVNNAPSDYTLRGVADEAGMPAITVEICDPQTFQWDPIRKTLQGMMRILNHVGMIPRRTPVKPRKKQMILCERSYWILTERGGLMNVFHKVTDKFGKGDLISQQTNIFGDVIHQYFAPEDGYVIGHCINPIGQTGARIMHLGVPMAADRIEQFKATCSDENLTCTGNVR
jgi:predicted deacylase